MAKARRTTRVIKRVQKTTVPAVVLELGEGEADFLQAVMAMIGGSEADSPRKYAIRIARALKNATGQEYKDTDAYKLLRRNNPDLFFKDYPPRVIDNGASTANIKAAVEYMKTHSDPFGTFGYRTAYPYPVNRHA